MYALCKPSKTQQGIQDTYQITSYYNLVHNSIMIFSGHVNVTLTLAPINKVLVNLFSTKFNIQTEYV